MASHHQHPELSEVNQKFFDANADTLLGQDWAVALKKQVVAFLLANLDTVGVRQKSEDGAPVRMLDYACGPGTVSLAMGPYVHVLRGIDISQVMVDKYNAAAKSTGCTPEQMAAVRGDLLAAESRDLENPAWNNFDIVILSMALHHVSEQQHLVRKLAERMRPGGVLIVIDWVPVQGDSMALGEYPEVQRTTRNKVLSRSYVESLYFEAGCSASEFQYIPCGEESLLPESMTKVPGGVRRRLFIAASKKLG